MKSKLCWVTFIPAALAVVCIKVLEAFNIFPDLPTNTLSYIGVTVVLVMFAINIIFIAADKKTSPAYLLSRDVPAALFAIIGAGAIASRTALTLIQSLQNNTFEFMTLMMTIFGVAAAICMVVIGLAHLQGRNFLPRMAALLLVLPVWAGLALINEFLNNRKVSVAGVDTFRLFALAFGMIVLFKLSMIIATVDGRNPVKALYLYGLPFAAIGMGIGAANIANIIQHGIDYSENVIGLAFFSLGLYTVFFLIELTKYARTKDEQIVQFDLDEFDEDQRIYGAFQDNYVAAPEEQTGDYDYDYSHAGVEVESFVSSKNEDYTPDYDYYYGYGDSHEDEELVVAPEEDVEEDNDAIYVDSRLVGDFEEPVLGARTFPNEEAYINNDENDIDEVDMDKINKLIDDINS